LSSEALAKEDKKFFLDDLYPFAIKLQGGKGQPIKDLIPKKFLKVGQEKYQVEI